MKKALRQILIHTAQAACLLSLSSIALAEEKTNSNIFPAVPGFTVMGLSGDSTNGYGDVLLPLFGQADSFFHVDAQGMLHNNDEYALSFGGGFRHLSESTGIWGAYVFGDYNHSVNGNSFWFVSPGIEFLGRSVDVNANLYVPTGDKQKTVSVDFAETMGIYDYIHFQGHSQYDLLMKNVEAVGAGGDVEVGVFLPMKNRPKLSVGGYYFSPENAEENISGITARLEVPLTDQLTLQLSDAYDNVNNNTFKVGVSYSFGGRKNGKKFAGNLRERMVDPVRRNLIAVAGPSNTFQPVVEQYEPAKYASSHHSYKNYASEPNAAESTYEEQPLLKQAQMEEGMSLSLVHNDIAFFDQNANANGDGTFERPFNVFSQNTVDLASEKGLDTFFVNTGVYEMGAQTITLIDKALYGRENIFNIPFILPAFGENRPLFHFELPGRYSDHSAFVLQGNSIIDSIRMDGLSIRTDLPFGDFETKYGNGINIDSPEFQTTVSLHNIEVKNFYNGIRVNHAKKINMDVVASDIVSNSGDGLGFAYLASDNIDLNIFDSSFNNNGNYGLWVQTVGVANVDIAYSNFTENNGSGAELFLNNNFAAKLNLNVTDSRFDHNGRHGLAYNGWYLNANIYRSSFSHNGHDGMWLRGGKFAYGDVADLQLSISNSRFNYNQRNGLYFEDRFYESNGMGEAVIDAVNSSFSHNGQYGWSLHQATPGNLEFMPNNSIFFGNGEGSIYYENTSGV
jgi:hypothetical protein